MPNETIVPEQTPKTLDAWVKLLDSVRLPVPLASYERVKAAIADSRRSLRDIAEIMQGSPALVLSVMREANHHTNSSTGEPAESLEIALNRLGLARTAALLERLPALPAGEISPTLRQLQLVSQHASQQASGLFASRLARLWQEIHWGSLLFLSPLWPLALAYPKLLEDWELRVVHKGESASRVEKELFGVRVLSLCKAMAEHWRLPEWVTRGYHLLQDERRLLSRALHIARDQNSLSQQRRLDESPDLRRWFNQPANTVLLANGLALAAQAGWTNPHVRRWQLLTSLYLQTSLDDVQQLVHQQAAISARHHACPDLLHPAEALLWPWSQQRLHPGQIAPPPPSAQALGTWRKLCAELLVEPSPFTNAIHLTTLARDALVACGMQRVVLLMTDKTQSQLRVHQYAGVPAETANLLLSIEQSKLLQRLVSKSAQLRLTPENHAQFSALLPASLSALFLRSEHLLLRSLSSNGRVVMLLIADQGAKPLADISVQAFGKTAQCIERALTVFSNRSA